MFIFKVGCYAEPLYKILAKYLENWQIYPIVKFSDNNINDKLPVSYCFHYQKKMPLGYSSHLHGSKSKGSASHLPWAMESPLGEWVVSLLLFEREGERGREGERERESVFNTFQNQLEMCSAWSTGLRQAGLPIYPGLYPSSTLTQVHI